MSHLPTCNGPHQNRPQRRQSKRDEWREQIPTRQAKQTLDNRNETWLQWLLPPAELHDFLLWPIPRIAIFGLALSASNVANNIWGDGAATIVLLILAVPAGLFFFASMSAARGNEALSTITFILMLTGAGIASLFIFAKEVCYAALS